MLSTARGCLCAQSFASPTLVAVCAVLSQETTMSGSAPLQVTKNLFGRLLVSANDIRHALFCADVLLTRQWRHTMGRGGTHVAEREAFTTALVVSYGRPFTMSIGWPKFPKSLISASY